VLGIREGRTNSLPAFSNQQVEAHNAIFIAYSGDGVVARDVVFKLEHLLCRASQIRNLGDRDIARNLLLNRKPGIGIVVGTAGCGIDTYCAHTKQA